MTITLVARKYSALALTLAVAACSSGTGPSQPTTVIVTPSQPTTVVKGALQFTVSADQPAAPSFPHVTFAVRNVSGSRTSFTTSGCTTDVRLYAQGSATTRAYSQVALAQACLPEGQTYFLNDNEVVQLSLPILTDRILANVVAGSYRLVATLPSINPEQEVTVGTVTVQ